MITQRDLLKSLAFLDEDEDPEIPLADPEDDVLQDGDEEEEEEDDDGDDWDKED